MVSVWRGNDLAVVVLGGAVLGISTLAVMHDKIKSQRPSRFRKFNFYPSSRNSINNNHCPPTLTPPCLNSNKLFTMPSALGKRKSRPVEEEPEAQVDAQELLRRHFEARFKPLAAGAPPRAAPKKAANGHPDTDDSEGSDDSDYSQDDDDSDAETGQSDEWGGVSDDEGMQSPVIYYTTEPRLRQNRCRRRTEYC